MIDIKKEPLVSIITPLYNTEKFIGETIESVLNQTYKNWEMIIVDDCSTDNGGEIVKNHSLKDSRIKYIKLEKNSGAVISRNTAIEESQGRYIAFLDSDDLWKEKKLEKQISFMEENNYNFTYHEYEEMSEEGISLGRKIIAPKKPLTYRKYLLTTPIGCLTGIYNAEKLGKIYQPNIKKRQDAGLWLRILRTGEKAYSLKENLGKYRIRKNSLSANKMDLIKYNWELYKKEEKLSILESSFYLMSIIVTKILKLKEKKIKNEHNIEGRI